MNRQTEQPSTAKTQLRGSLEYVQRRVADALRLEGTEQDHLIPEVLMYLQGVLDTAKTQAAGQVRERLTLDPVFAARVSADRRPFSERIDEALKIVP